MSGIDKDEFVKSAEKNVSWARFRFFQFFFPFSDQGDHERERKKESEVGERNTKKKSVHPELPVDQPPHSLA